ncbi:uncharacterized protein [Clinocottus analis]|uniref:uncharacterized protein n=1 Tax=Clinocottus analis TaxID=304258 RepID=UPI0035C24EF3
MEQLHKLTRKHGVKIAPCFPCSVEDCSLAVGKLVGYSSVKSAARVNRAVVIFLESVQKVNTVVQEGIVVFDTHVPVFPLSTPAVRVVVSNVPPFMKDDMITGELSRHGRVVSPVKKLSSGCKSPLLKHVVSHRRQLFMILNNRNEELNLVFKLREEGFDYVLFATSDNMKCFSCGREGHQSKACPQNKSAEQDGNKGKSNQKDTEGRGDKQDVQERQQRTGGLQEETGGLQEETGGLQEMEEEAAEIVQQVDTEGTNVVNELEEAREGVVQQVEEEEAAGAQGSTHSQEDSQVCTGGQVEADEIQKIVKEKEKCGSVKTVEAVGVTGSEVDMEEDEEAMKAPRLERKTRSMGNPQAKEVTVSTSWGSRAAAEEESSSQSEAVRPSGRKSTDEYSVRRIKDFLRRLKQYGWKHTLAQHFSDKEKIIDVLRAHLTKKTKSFTMGEVLKIKRMIGEMDGNKTWTNDEDDQR